MWRCGELCISSRFQNLQKQLLVVEQVMSPMRKGAAGTGSLNLRLQALLNPGQAGEPELQRRCGPLQDTDTLTFRRGDRIIQVRLLLPPSPWAGLSGSLEVPGCLPC